MVHPSPDRLDPPPEAACQSLYFGISQHDPYKGRSPLRLPFSEQIFSEPDNPAPHKFGYPPLLWPSTPLPLSPHPQGYGGLPFHPRPPRSTDRNPIFLRLFSGMPLRPPLHSSDGIIQMNSGASTMETLFTREPPLVHFSLPCPVGLPFKINRLFPPLSLRQLRTPPN